MCVCVFACLPTESCSKRICGNGFSTQGNGARRRISFHSHFSIKEPRAGPRDPAPGHPGGISMVVQTNLYQRISFRAVTFANGERDGALRQILTFGSIALHRVRGVQV